ncbi:MAG: hypothetical protein PHC92_07520 [Syntrophomonadaceae bacterium]|nr:hypothetical protein [Syntrophomonadaceae bacterium]MDD3024670.1 hypothetical protein [Syntrophomonadaceae bacterium]
MRLSKRETILLCLFLIISMVFVYYKFSYKPSQNHMNSLLQENILLKDLIEKGKKAESSMNIREKNTVLKVGEKLLREIPTRAGVPETIAYLENTCRDTKVTLLSVNGKIANNKINSEENEKKQGVELEKIRVLDYNISIQGSYNNLLVFLLKLENSSRLYTINNCKMTVNAKKFDEVELNEDAAPNKEDDTVVSNPQNITSDAKGSKSYDGNNIMLDLIISAYYDEESIPDINIGADDVLPASGKTNPFL